ncbi:MAG: anthranilate 1,2-dioxygenase large subunit [Alphaproteobacteria bacterium]|nr:anthranilate 1,2-dioxygenase large subunit [Alphaproteobacteria bacterium]
MVAPAAQQPSSWPEGMLTRVPFWIYQSSEVYEQEQRRVYEGPVWNYLCLEAEIPNPGDFRTTFAGSMPVVVTRDLDGQIYAFENRCAHKGAMLCLDNEGNGRDITCVYHSWNYDLQGNLKGVAFERGVGGKGGMPKTFRREEHGPRKLRVARFSGLIFGSLSGDAPPIRDYLGEEIAKRIERVLCKPVAVIGRFAQALPNNWKLYFENVKDSYHASLLHLFFTTFRINRLSQKGGLIVAPGGGHHVSYAMADPAAVNAEYSEQKLRSEKENYKLADPSLVAAKDEFGDGVVMQILTVFPGFVLQQHLNSLAVRQVLPKGVQSTMLHWTYLGFADDTPEMRRMRLKQANLIGPAGYISMEDGAVGGFVQRGVASAAGESAIVEMGGDSTSSEDTRATEASVRGFWKAYRGYMGI